MSSVNRQFVLASRPTGLPEEANFKLIETPIPELKDGEFLARAMYISKHRGSACSEEIIPYWIDDEGVKLGARDEGRGASGL